MTNANKHDVNQPVTTAGFELLNEPQPHEEAAKEEPPVEVVEPPIEATEPVIEETGNA